MDVVFYEEDIYFHRPELQGEHCSKVQALDCGNEDKIIQAEVSSLSSSQQPNPSSSLQTSSLLLSLSSTLSTLLIETMPSPDTNNQFPLSNIFEYHVSSSDPLKKKLLIEPIEVCLNIISLIKPNTL